MSLSYLYVQMKTFRHARDVYPRLPHAVTFRTSSRSPIRSSVTRRERQGVCSVTVTNARSNNAANQSRSVVVVD